LQKTTCFGSVTDFRANNENRNTVDSVKLFLFSAIFKNPASAQGEILSADWTKHSSPPFRAFLNLQNIMKTLPWLAAEQFSRTC
jgi:hypothetical protein